MRLVVSLGSNVEDREIRLQNALTWLKKTFGMVLASDIYPTEPVGHGHGPYANAVALIETSEDPDVIDRLFKNYEISQGRDENSRKAGLVPVDLDIVMTDDDIIRPWEFSQSFFRRGYAGILK